MGDELERPASRASGKAARDLRLVMENLELLWDREDAGDSSVVISPSQLRVLGALERAPGLNLRELGEVIGSAPSALSRLCARLEAMGFVRRLPSSQSGREIELHVTHRATTCLRELRERREHALAAVLESVPPTGYKPLAEGLAALRLALDARLRPPVEELDMRSA